MNACIRRERSYWTTCPCDQCVRTRARTRKLHSMGRRRTITHQQAWDILAAKFESGWTALAVSSATNLPDHYFTRHHARWQRGEECLIGPMLAEALTNVGTPTRGQVGAEPTRRRLRALAAIGYGLDQLAAETNIGTSTLAAARNTNVRVGAGFAITVSEAYERLHMHPGPNSQASRKAKEKGWPPPLAWDDIDDPNEQPADWHYTPTPRVDQLTDLVASGANLTHATRRLGVSVNTLNKWCGHTGNRHLYLALAAREGDWNSSGRIARDGAA